MPTCLGLHMLEERQAMHKTFEIPLDIPDVMIEKVGTDRHGDFVITVKSTIEGTHCGFDHRVGHSLLLLYDAKAPHSQKSKEFKGLGHYPTNIPVRLFLYHNKIYYLYNYLIFLLFL